MDNSPRAVFLLVILVFVFLTPDQSYIRRQALYNHESLEESRKIDAEVLQNSTFNASLETGFNLTGFREDENYQWHLCALAQAASREQYRTAWDGTFSPVYQRLDGEVWGSFAAENVVRNHSRVLNLTQLAGEHYFSRDFQRNITESEGEASIYLQEPRRSGLANEIKGSLSIYTSSAPGSGWVADLQGVHFPNGSVILATSSRKFNSLPAFPLFTLNEEDFNLSKAVINASLPKIWQAIPELDVTETAIPSCEMIVWLQQKPLPGTSKYIEQIESELSNPQGAPIGIPPPLAFSAVIFSPDCGYVLKVENFVGPKAEAYWERVQRLLAAFIIIVSLQIALLKRQMEKCATPSTRSRISYYSIGIAAFGDGLLLFAMIGLVMIEGQAFALFAAAAFLCIMHVAFFEVKFIFDIWTVQVGDLSSSQRNRPSRLNTSPPPPSSQTQPPQLSPPPPPPPPPVTRSGVLPLPVTAPADGAVALAAPIATADAPRTTFASLYSRFYFALVNLMFFSLWAMSWPQKLRSAYINILAFCYLSLWIPQIYRNIMRNCRKALNWEFVMGASVLRAIPIVYWYLDDKNVLSAHTNPISASILLAWLWIQIVVLLSQQYLGPRLLVRESWCPPAYDYHPILTDDVEAGGMHIGALASASEGKDKNNKSRKVFDCAICMNDIDVPVASKDEHKGRSWMEQGNYMVTPCRHIFHAECLEGWMNLRLVCPVCREDLPPL